VSPGEQRVTDQSQVENQPRRWLRLWRSQELRGALVLALFLLIFLSKPIAEYRTSYYSGANLTQDYSLLRTPPNVVPGNRLASDPVLQMLPWLQFSKHEFEQGRLPLWNPYNGCGVPHMANYQSAVFSPFSAVYYLLGERLALLVMAFLVLYSHGLFTFLFLRLLSCRWLAALSAATAFMFRCIPCCSPAGRCRCASSKRATPTWSAAACASNRRLACC
jgi:hypothetical protein